ncbi:MAG: isoprenylcysteine carboxyl methyltransferase family protein [Thermodesulfobacteriota bacterium]
MLLAKRNEKIVRKDGAVEYDRSGYKYIVAMHAAFFISFLSEYFFLDKTLNSHCRILTVIFILSQALRYWSIASLGKYWNTKVLVVPGTPVIKSGPYNYFRHPNYLVVLIEIAVTPLIFSCYLTSALFTILNLILLRRRIEIEESVLSNFPIRE